MTRTFGVALCVFALAYSSWSLACTDLFTGKANISVKTLSPEERYIAYLREIAPSDKLYLDVVSRLRDRADIYFRETGRVPNPVDFFQEGSLIAAHTHRNVFNVIVELPHWNLDKFLIELDRSEQVIRSRTHKETVVYDDTKLIQLDIKLYTLSAGEILQFSRGSRSLHNVVVEKDLEVMSFPVTHYQFMQVMGYVRHTGAVPATGAYHLPHSKGLWVDAPDGRGQVYILPDHPVKRASLPEILMFANLLSIEHGYEPYYVPLLAPVDMRTLRGRPDLIKQLSFDLVQSQKFDGNGYRLPSLDEHEYFAARAVDSLIGIREWHRIDQNRFHEIWHHFAEYGWFYENSQSENDHGYSMAVQLKKPIQIDQGYFYDVFGNVPEANSSYFDPNIFGKGYQLNLGRNTTIFNALSAPRSQIDPSQFSRSQPQGIRLVREIR